MTNAADPGPTPLGRLLERARVELNISKREAAVRAGISETRWRQVVTGVQKAGGRTVEARPRRRTVTAMARAVGVDVGEAMKAAGFPELPEAGPHGPVERQAPSERVETLIEDIWADPRVPEERKAALVRLIRQAEADRQAVEDELRRWRGTPSPGL